MQHGGLQVRILRQKDPHSSSRWETFEIEREPGMNVTTVLQRIAARPVTIEHQPTTPVAYDACCLEEVCGACSMLINGKVRQACSALIDVVAPEGGPPLELRPMTKFPVVRDLVVNRRRMFDALKKVKAWVHVDDYFDRGPGPRIFPKVQEQAYPLSRCMTCGCCVEACPQYHDDSPFIGPAAISQAVLFNMHPTGQALRDDRLDVFTSEEGIAGCGNSQNCVKVCPKEIPLTDSIARAGRDATLHVLRRWFGR